MYLGIALILISLALFALSLNSLIPLFQSSQSVRNLTVLPGSMKSIPVMLNDTNFTSLVFGSKRSFDFFFANYSAFSSLGSKNSTRIETEAPALEGRGIFEAYFNATGGEFPFVSLPNETQPGYFNITFLRPGTYYAIFYNPGASQDNISVGLRPFSLSGLESQKNSFFEYTGVAALSFIAGICLAIYGFVSGAKRGDEMQIDKEAAREYELMERKKKVGKSG